MIFTILAIVDTIRLWRQSRISGSNTRCNSGMNTTRCTDEGNNVDEGNNMDIHEANCEKSTLLDRRVLPNTTHPVSTPGSDGIPPRISSLEDPITTTLPAPSGPTIASTSASLILRGRPLPTLRSPYYYYCLPLLAYVDVTAPNSPMSDNCDNSTNPKL
eukprot:Filipodium_phascolosomae@DN2143_c0_g1_i1.p1